MIMFYIATLQSCGNEDILIAVKMNGKDTTIERELNNSTSIMKGEIKSYNDIAKLLVIDAKSVIHKNAYRFPNLKESDIFAVMMTCFMIESKHTGNHAPGTSLAYITGFNGFGMKAGSSWKGEILTTPYWEVVKGKRINYPKKGQSKKSIRANSWRQYNSIKEAMNGWIEFIDRKVYKKAKFTKSAEGMAFYVAKRYSTNPKAPEQWINIINKYNFRKIYNGK